jgi:excisionase family DNA binding protein
MKILYTVNEACDVLGIKRTALYERQKAGLITFRKDGTRTLVDRDELERYAASLPKVA